MSSALRLKNSVASKNFHSVAAQPDNGGGYPSLLHTLPLLSDLQRRLWQSCIPTYVMLWSLQLLLMLEEDAAMLAFCCAS